MNNLVKRGITGAIYVLSVIAAIYIHPIITAIYFLIIAMIGLYEFYSVARVNNKNFNVLGMLLGLNIYSYISSIAICLNYNIVYSIVIAVMIILIIFITELYTKNDNPFTNIAYTLTGIIYVVIPLALTNIIINFNGKYSPMILMSVFIFAWCNDTFAYLIGMKFGKHKLFERISPKKTWEGWIGGFLFTIIAAIIISICSKVLSTIDFIVIALITSVIGTFGDLVESMFKRQNNVKDSGNILPGHGGILDRFDILLLVLPAVWCYLLIRF